MKLKVLAATEIMRFYGIEDLGEPCDPLIGRDGIYRRGNDCWAEVDGRAVKYDKEMFEYKIAQCDHKPLRPETKAALRHLTKEGYATRDQKILMQRDDEWHQIRETWRMTRLSFIKGDKNL